MSAFSDGNSRRIAVQGIALCSNFRFLDRSAATIMENLIGNYPEPSSAILDVETKRVTVMPIFVIGSRVRLSAAGLRTYPQSQDLRGEVVGANCRSDWLLTVKWDGWKRTRAVAKHHLQHESDPL